MAFSIVFTAPLPFMMPMDFWSETAVVDLQGRPLGTCLSAVTDRWNDGEYPTEVGEHIGVPIFPVPVQVDNGYGTLAPIELTLNIEVSARRYFGHLPLTAIRGLRDEQTGHVFTNAFTTGALNPDQVEQTWQLLGDGEDPPKPVTLVAVGLYLLDIH